MLAKYLSLIEILTKLQPIGIKMPKKFLNICVICFSEFLFSRGLRKIIAYIIIFVTIIQKDKRKGQYVARIGVVNGEVVNSEIVNYHFIITKT